MKARAAFDCDFDCDIVEAHRRIDPMDLGMREENMPSAIERSRRRLARHSGKQVQ